MFSGRYITETALTLVTAVTVGMTLLFNDINIQIRVKEITSFLRRSSREDNSIDHIGLVMKYRLQKEIYENRLSGEDTGIIETRINSILSGREDDSGDIAGRYRYLSVPVLFSINIIRYLIGMPPIEDVREDQVNLDLDVAYYYERNKEYKKAISLYSRILDEPVSGRSLKAGVLLHMGFCYSILGDYNRAKEKYLTVIKEYGDINTAVTAAVMLRYLEGFRTEIEKVLKYEKDSTSKGEKLYKLIAYTESYEVLKRIENTASGAEKEKIKYFKGRTLEELGESGKAVEIYQEIIADNPRSTYSAPANRRIYLIGTVNIEGDKIRKLAAENNRLIKDEMLVKMADEETKFRRAGLNRKSGTGIKSAFIEKLEGTDVSRAARSDSIDRMIRDAEVRASGSKGDEPGLREQKETRVKIFTKDGNIFTGTVVRETSAEIVISSSLGNIKIKKSKISRRVDL